MINYTHLYVNRDKKGWRNNKKQKKIVRKARINIYYIKF